MTTKAPSAAPAWAIPSRTSTVLARRVRRRRQPADPGSVQPLGWQSLCGPDALRAGQAGAPLRLCPPARGARGADRGAGADARPRLEAALPGAVRDRGHAVARRAGVRDAAEPVLGAGQNRAPAGLYRSRHERLTGRALAGGASTRSDPCDALCGLEVGRSLTSPKVSPFRCSSWHLLGQLASGD